MSDFLLTEIVSEVRGQFAAQFGSAPDFVVAAPGRVNLIGEHIDYNDGFVLPMAIERYTVIAAKARGESEMDNRIAAFHSIDMDETLLIALDKFQKGDRGSWGNYVVGVLAGMSAGMLDQGASIPPFNAVSRSNVPIGGGLSSSASLEVAVGTMVETLTGNAVDSVAKGLVCQKAEHDYVGVPCGIMDQFASVLCEKDRVLLLDCQDQSFQQIPFSNPDIAVLIINSEVEHELSGGEYAQRRSQCDKAARVLEADSWRGVTMDQVTAKQGSMDPVVFKRARHVVSEIARTTDAANALQANQWEIVGELMYASHRSLKDDFEVSCRELDLLVDLAKHTDGVIGSRMTGGGFGGCTVTLVKSDEAAVASESICQQYEQATGVKPTAFVTRPARGTHVIDT